MPGQNDILAGRACVEAYLDSRKLNKGLAAAQKRLRDFGNGMATMGRSMMMGSAAIIAPIIAATKHFAQAGDTLDKVSSKLGVCTNAFSELAFAAEQTGVGQKTFAMALQRMTRRLAEAARGMGEAQSALKELQLDAVALARMSPDQAFMTIASAMENVTNQSDRVRLSFKLFDSEGVALVNTLALGADGLEKLRNEARELGLSIGPEQAKSAAELTDAINRAKRSVSAAFFQIGAAIAPVMKDMAKWIKDVALKTQQWVSENKNMIVAVGMTAAKVAAAGAALFVLGKAITGVAAALGILNAAAVFLMANPLAAAFAAVVASAAGLVYVIHDVTTHTAKLAEAQANARSAGDKLRKSSQLQVQRLEQLAEKQNLSNSEMQEAQGIIAALEGHYGGLGVSIDKATGKIVGLAGAQQKLNDAMRNAAIKEAQAEWSELQQNAEELYRESKSAWTAAGQQDAANRLNVVLKKMYAIRMRIRALNGGDDAALTGEPAKRKTADDTLAGKIADEEEIAKRQKEWEHELRQIEIQGIEDTHDRRLAAIDEEYDYKIQKLKDAGEYDSRRNLQITASRIAEKANVEKDRQRELDAAKKRAAEEEARLAEDLADREKQIANDTAVAKINATKTGIDKEMALLRLRHKREREEALKAGLDPKVLAAKHKYEEQIAMQGAAMQSGGGSVRGTFSASAISGMGMGGGLQQRIAEAVEGVFKFSGETTTLTKELKEEFKRFNLEAAP